MGDDLNPWVLYRLDGGQVECALWQLREGGKALAVFSTEQSAANYRGAAGFTSAWRTYRPVRSALFELLRTAHQQGIAHAVLDPDRESARLIFPIADILAIVGG